MIFGKKDHLVGLDIDSKTIKVGEVVETKNGLRLKKFGILDITPGAIVEGVIKKPEEVAGSIRQLFNLYNIKEQNVAISIGGYSVIVKTINVQKMSGEQFSEIMHLEAEQYIPFDISDVNLDFQILDDSENKTNQMQVLLVAAKKETVAEYVDLVKKAGLNPCVVDIDAFALQNMYEATYEVNDEHVALIDIGASKTSLNILKGSSSQFMRDVSFGCGQINSKIITQTGCSWEESELIKLGEKSDKLSAVKLNEIISSVVADWSAEITHALDIYYSTYTDERIKRIYLSGGGVHIEALHEMLAMQTETEVKSINPFRNLRLEGEGLDTDYLLKVAPQAAICMGLAIRRVDDK